MSIKETESFADLKMLTKKRLVISKLKLNSTILFNLYIELSSEDNQSLVSDWKYNPQLSSNKSSESKPDLFLSSSCKVREEVMPKMERKGSQRNESNRRKH